MDVLQILSSSLKQLHVPVDPLNQAIWVTGAVILTMFSLRLMSFLYTHLIMDMDMGTFGAKKGGYALVTGASEGIGRAICFELARRGSYLPLLLPLSSPSYPSLCSLSLTTSLLPYIISPSVPLYPSLYHTLSPHPPFHPPSAIPSPFLLHPYSPPQASTSSSSRVRSRAWRR